MLPRKRFSGWRGCGSVANSSDGPDSLAQLRAQPAEAGPTIGAGLALPAPRVLDRGGSDTRTGECHVRDSAGRGGGLDLVVLLEALQSVPEAYASAEQDRDHHRVHVVDEPGGDEVADHCGASAEAYVLAAGSLAGYLERLGRRGVDEVVRRAALHLDRRAR